MKYLKLGTLAIYSGQFKGFTVLANKSLDTENIGKHYNELSRIGVLIYFLIIVVSICLY